jgi:ubiquinol-cytochrome c reductase cytochrome b subunit
MRRVLEWIERRTGIGELAREVLDLPGGACWHNSWAMLVAFLLAAEVATGFFLWLAYSPSSQTAWESVFFLQVVMKGGWLLRALHHYLSDALIVVLALHLLQMLVSGTYRAPREVNYWVGLGLLLLVAACATTGYLLPWDQHGYWGTKVRLGYIGLTPVAGPALERLAQGGPALGSYSLTRFFALHAGLLPMSLGVLVFAQRRLLKRHAGVPAAWSKGGCASYWPDQALRDGIVCVAAFVAVFTVALHAQNGMRGAPLTAPADPFDRYDAARPEWYFRWLFQFVKYFPGNREVWGAVVLPGLAFSVTAALPLIARWKRGHRFNVIWISGFGAGAVLLSVLSMHDDWNDLGYQAAVKLAARDAERARELAEAPAGIPITGAASLMRNDPFTQGPRLFAQKCAACHRYGGEDGMGRIPAQAESAADLRGFGSNGWLQGLLDPGRIGTTNYFGATALRDGKMAKFVKKDVAGYSPDEKAMLVEALAAVSADAGLKSQRSDDAREQSTIEAGRKVFHDGLRCAECHAFHGAAEDTTAPNLTGYGSRGWLVKFITNPADPDFYGELNDRMPAFGASHQLSPDQIGLIADWLRGEWYEKPEAADK